MRRAYLLGGLLVVLLALAGGAMLGPAGQRGLLLALGLTLAVQGPLGWWLLRSVGTARFLGVWVGGMLARLLLVALAGLVLVPALGWPAAPILVSLVALLFAFLVVEGIALVVAPRGGARIETQQEER